MKTKETKLTPTHIIQTAEHLQVSKHNENQACVNWATDDYLQGYDQRYWDALDHLLEKLGLKQD